MITYTLEDEDVDECEWEFYTINEDGRICDNKATKVIIENDDENPMPYEDEDNQPTYLRGSHLGHLCDIHAPLVWPHFAAANEHGGDSKTDIGDTIQHEGDSK